MKKLTIIGVTIVGLGAIGCATLKNSTNTDDNKVNQAKWQKEAPQLFNDAGYSKLVASNLTQAVSNSQKHIGKVTNPFGIRDDVLTFILNYFPNNESAVYAAIRIEQTNTSIYYANISKSAVKISNDGEIAIWCLAKNIGFTASDKYLDSLEHIRLTTNEGKLMDQDVRKKLGWKGLGNNLSKEQMNQICEKVNY